jgi:hypothetical protein
MTTQDTSTTPAEYTFDYNNFIAMFPEFTKLSEELVEPWSNIAVDLFGHMCVKPTVLDDIVNLAVAHLVYTRYSIDPEDPEEYTGVNIKDMGDTTITTSKSVGTSSISTSGTLQYVPDSTSAFLNTLSTTKYGMLLLSLLEIYAPVGYLVK